MADQNIWHLHFNLAEFAPADVEIITSLSATMQRDWRHRGFLAKSDKHARFTAFALAEALVMKMFSDRGIGPARSHFVAPRMARAIVLEVLCYNREAWGEYPEAVFDNIRANSGAFTNGETQHFSLRPSISHLRRFGFANDWGPHRLVELNFIDKMSDLADRLFSALQIPDVDRSRDIIWWPNDEVEFGNYEELINAAESIHWKLDPRFDGVAMVISVSAIASNLAKKLTRPLVNPFVRVFDSSPLDLQRGVDRGQTTVSYGTSALVEQILLDGRPRAQAHKRGQGRAVE